MMMALLPLHYELLAASSGAYALASLRGPVVPDLVLLEPMMKDGWEVLAALDTDPHLKRTPVLVVTGLPEVSAPHGRPVLHKPFGARQLARAVAALCPPVALQQVVPSALGKLGTESL